METVAEIDRGLQSGKGPDMATIAVIGAGQMGSGIAQTAAQFGYNVLLSDVDLSISQ